MDFERARFNMVEQQVRTWEVFDQRVLETLMTVRREQFVPQSYRTLAFAEVEIPLGFGERMLRPVIEGKVLQAVQLQKSEVALEIGAGSGYFAACLAHLGQWVHSVEIVPELATRAQANLEAEGFDNVEVITGDGLEALAAPGPFDVIVLSGGVPEVPRFLLDALKAGGRLFAFVGDERFMHGRLYTCSEPGKVRYEDLFETVVPMLRVPQPVASALVLV